MNIDDIITSTGAVVLKNELKKGDFEFSTDTRTLKKNEIYLPLKGENFDGEKFIENALKSGAEGYFTTKDEVFEGAKIVLKVENTLEAYLKLASFRLKSVSPKVIAITGSSGKTTTKEIVASVCEKAFKTHKTALNHNNEVGFCQTIFSMPKDCEVLILEFGMRGLGEIELLSKYSNPDITIITNAGTAHIGRLGNEDNIAKAKCEIALYQKEYGVFIAENNPLIKKYVTFSGEKRYFSLEDVQILEKSIGYSKFCYEKEEYELSIEGDYNIKNSLAAIEVAKVLNIPVKALKKGLKEYKPIQKRWEIEEIKGYKFINDSYNANPDSMKAFLKTVFELYENSVVVLGDMGELGENEKLYHRQVGEFIVQNIEDKSIKFLLLGELMSETAEVLKSNDVFVKTFNDKMQITRYILDNINHCTTIFLKASRSMKLEEITQTVKGETDL